VNNAATWTPRPSAILLDVWAVKLTIPCSMLESEPLQMPVRTDTLSSDMPTSLRTLRMFVPSASRNGLVCFRRGMLGSPRSVEDVKGDAMELRDEKRRFRRRHGKSTKSLTAVAFG
jgi:hypothetical protein